MEKGEPLRTVRRTLSAFGRCWQPEQLIPWYGIALGAGMELPTEDTQVDGVAAKEGLGQGV